MEMVSSESTSPTIERVATIHTTGLFLHLPDFSGDRRRRLHSQESRADRDKHVVPLDAADKVNNQERNRPGATSSTHTTANIVADHVGRWKRNHDKSYDFLYTRNTPVDARGIIPSDGRSEVYMPWSNLDHYKLQTAQTRDVQPPTATENDMQKAEMGGNVQGAVGLWDKESLDQFELPDHESGIPIVHVPWNAVFRLSSNGEQRRSEDGVTASDQSSMYARESSGTGEIAGEISDQVRGQPVKISIPSAHIPSNLVLESGPVLEREWNRSPEGSEKRDNEEKRAKEEVEKVRDGQLTEKGTGKNKKAYQMGDGVGRDGERGDESIGKKSRGEGKRSMRRGWRG